MPVRKFRSVDELQRPRWHRPGDPSLAVAMKAVWEFADQTAPQRFPPGVYRHHSITEAEVLREQWAAANFHRLWAARGGLPRNVATEVREPEQ